MSTMPSKTNIPVATPGKTRKFYTQQHLTTCGFMQPRPIFCREYIPKRNMEVKVNTFIRANTMPVPIFGHAKVFNRAFFVPFRAIMPDFNNFYTASPYAYAADPASPAIPSHVPVIQNNTFVRFFIEDTTLTSAGSAANFDFVYFDGSQHYYTFTKLGRKYYTIIESLGYKINWIPNDKFLHSALNLMAYTKVMLDWYWPSAYVGSSDYYAIQSMFDIAVHDRSLNINQLDSLLSASKYVTYDPDYFVNAFDNPVGPNSNVELPLSIVDITNNSVPQIVTNSSSLVVSPSQPVKPTNLTPFIGGSNSVGANASGVLTQYVIDSLKALTDYTKRHSLSGVRSIDRYLSELGVNLSAEIMKRSMYLGSQSFDMEFYDVFSHADTSASGGVPLGAYGGKGTGFSGNKSFTFDDGQEFGAFIIVNSIIPEIGYFQGQHRETMHVNSLDFYHGDFDHLGNRAISTREVFVTQKGDVAVSGYAVDNGQGLNTTIFGYGPQYIEYNTPEDLQTGLYRVRTQQNLLPCYSLMRDLDYFEDGTLAQMKHTAGFVLGSDSDQYNRIFYSQNDLDNFNAVHTFEVTNIDSTLPAYDTYEFDHDVENKEVTLEVNGAKLN